jgi:hypothetical protein
LSPAKLNLLICGVKLAARTALGVAVIAVEPPAATVNGVRFAPVSLRLRAVASTTTLAAPPIAASAANRVLSPPSTEAQVAVMPPLPTVTA